MEYSNIRHVKIFHRYNVVLSLSVRDPAQCVRIDILYDIIHFSLSSQCRVVEVAMLSYNLFLLKCCRHGTAWRAECLMTR